MKIAQSNVNLMSNSSYNKGDFVNVSINYAPLGGFSDNLETQKQKVASDSLSTSTGECALGS